MVGAIKMNEEQVKYVMSEKGKKQFLYVYNKLASEKINEVSGLLLAQLEANKSYGTEYFVMSAKECRMGQERKIAFENDWFYSEGPIDETPEG